MRCGLDFLILEPKPSVLCLLGLARLSPLAEWRRKDRHRDPFVDVSRAEHILGLWLRLSNAQALLETYDWNLVHRDELAGPRV